MGFVARFPDGTGAARPARTAAPFLGGCAPHLRLLRVFEFVSVRPLQSRAQDDALFVCCQPVAARPARSVGTAGEPGKFLRGPAFGGFARAGGRVWGSERASSEPRTRGRAASLAAVVCPGQFALCRAAPDELGPLRRGPGGSEKQRGAPAPQLPFAGGQARPPAGGTRQSLRAQGVAGSLGTGRGLRGGPLLCRRLCVAGGTGRTRLPLCVALAGGSPHHGGGRIAPDGSGPGGQPPTPGVGAAGRQTPPQCAGAGGVDPDGAKRRAPTGHQCAARSTQRGGGGAAVSAALADRMFLSVGQMSAGLPPLAGREPAGRHAPIISGVDRGGVVPVAHRPATEQTDAGTLSTPLTGLGQHGGFVGGVGTGATAGTKAQSQKKQIAPHKKHWSQWILGAELWLNPPERRTPATLSATSESDVTPDPTVATSPAQSRAEHNWLPAQRNREGHRGSAGQPLEQW